MDLTGDMQPLMGPENFYGLPELPFNLHLGLTFERSEPAGPATLRVPLHPLDGREPAEQAPGAIYTVGEVAAAVATLDSLIPVMPVILLTRGGRFTRLATARGGVFTEARTRDGDTVVERLRAARKLHVEADVVLRDEDTREAVAEMTVRFYARPMRASLLKGLKEEQPVA